MRLSSRSNVSRLWKRCRRGRGVRGLFRRRAGLSRIDAIGHLCTTDSVFTPCRIRKCGIPVLSHLLHFVRVRPRDWQVTLKREVSKEKNETEKRERERERRGGGG